MRKLDLVPAKHRIRIPDLWQHFGFHGRPTVSCRCPWREDHHPSFSVFRDGLRWRDFGTGESGDAIDFLARASGLSRAAAFRKFIELAGTGRIAVAWSAAATRKRGRPHLPLFDPGTIGDLTQLAGRRNISIDGLQLARDRGLLMFATLYGWRAWVVTDSDRLNAQARRLDGGVWEHLDGRPKAYTLPGSCALWPVGIRETTESPNIALCEGGPDLLAAFHFIHCETRTMDCSAVSMLGASLTIHPNSLPFFAGKRVRIFGHDDADGNEAVERWAAQLAGAGADVDAFNFAGLRRVDGSPIKDLNDCTLVHADDFERNRELWGLMP